MNYFDEKEIIEKAKKDPEAFGLLFDKYYQPIFGYILRRTANVAIAEDLTSQTFLKALKKIKKFKWRNISFSAWIFRIATNEVNSFFRYKKRHKKIYLENFFNFSSDVNLLEELRQEEEKLQKNKEFLELHKAITKLNPRYQAVISLRFFEGKKIKEISQILNRSEGTIKSQLHRALKQLYKILHQQKEEL